MRTKDIKIALNCQQKAQSKAAEVGRPDQIHQVLNSKTLITQHS